LVSCYFDGIGKICFPSLDAHCQAPCLNEPADVVGDAEASRQVQQFPPRIDWSSRLIRARKTLQGMRNQRGLWRGNTPLLRRPPAAL
jgi:hypothetical protein